MAQCEAIEKLLKQAEEHRELAQRQFTDSMARKQAEHERTIEEATRIRDEYAKSAKMAQAAKTRHNKTKTRHDVQYISLL